ncbi:hypothetical protein C7271_02005 [filamentous cyanobacterium CCP5]|nr:hypothetical protein C7271_02005 [filamentous cyanobacterium CCP5]
MLRVGTLWAGPNLFDDKVLLIVTAMVGSELMPKGIAIVMPRLGWPIAFAQQKLKPRFRTWNRGFIGSRLS